MPETSPNDQPKPSEPTGEIHQAKKHSANYEARLDAFLSRRGVPALVLEILSLAWFIADTSGHIDFWRSIVARVGGNAEMIGAVLAQPLLPLLLAAFGAYLWWFMTEATTDAYNRAVYSSLCWILSAIVLIPLMTFALFANFVSSSSISDATKFVVEQERDRSLTNQQTTNLYNALRKIASGLPKFRVIATHDPETLQYAYLIMQSLYSADVKLANGEAGSSHPTASDIYDTSERGIMIAVENPMAPPKAALDLQDAFDAARIRTQMIKGEGIHGEDLFLLVGPK